MAGRVWEDYAEDRIRDELQQRLSAVSAHSAALVSTGPVLANTSLLNAQIKQLEAKILQKEAELAQHDTWLTKWFGVSNTQVVEAELSAYKTEHAELLAERQVVIKLQADIQLLQSDITVLRAGAASGQPTIASCSGCSKNVLSTSSFDEKQCKAEIARFEKEITRLENELQSALATNGAGYTPEQISVIKAALAAHAEKSRVQVREIFDQERAEQTDKFKNTRWRSALRYLFSDRQLFYLRPMPPEMDYYEELISLKVLESPKEFQEALDHNGFSGSLQEAHRLFKEQHTARTTLLPSKNPAAAPSMDPVRVKEATINLAKYISSQDASLFGDTYHEHVKTLGDSYLPIGVTLVSVQERLEQALADEFTIPDLENIIIGESATAGPLLPLHEVLLRLPYTQRTDPSIMRAMMQRISEFSRTLEISLHAKVGSEFGKATAVSDMAKIEPYNIWAMLSNKTKSVQDIISSLGGLVEKRQWVENMKEYTSAYLTKVLSATQKAKGKKTWGEVYRVYRTLFLVSFETPVKRTVWPIVDPLEDRSTWEDSAAVLEKASVSLQQEKLLEKVIDAGLKIQKRFDLIFTVKERQDACTAAGLDYATEIAKVNQASSAPTDPALMKYITMLKAGVAGNAVIYKVQHDTSLSKELIQTMEDYIKNKP